MAGGRTGRRLRDFTLNVPAFMTMANVPHLIRRAQPILRTDARFDRFVVNVQDLALISPVGLATLTSILRLADHERRFKQGLVRAPRRHNVRTYLSRMNFNRLIRMAEDPRQKPHRAPRRGRFRELNEFRDERGCMRITDHLCKVLESDGSLSESAVNSVHFCLSETTENVCHHAESPIHGVACAQYHNKSNAVELAIVDCGIGIRNSLSKNAKYASDVESEGDALRLAIARGVTSRPYRHSGDGLFFVAELLTRAGRMVLHSGGARLTISRSHVWPMIQDAPVWPGTIVGLRFERRKGISISEVFRRFSPPDTEEGPFQLEEESGRDEH